MKNILGKLVAIGVGVGVGVLLIELSLWVIPETRWKALVSKVPARHVLFQSDSNIGWVHTPGARAVWGDSGEFTVTVQINSLGLRDYERAYAKPADTFRILLLGDSFAEAIQVELEDTFAARLQTCLTDRVGRPVEIINAGVSAYGPGEELLFYTHEGIKYNADLVLAAVFVGNDIGDMSRTISDSMMQSFGGYRFYLNNGHLAQQRLDWVEDDKLSLAERFLRRYSKLYYILNSPDSRTHRELEKIFDAWQINPSPDAPLAQPRDLPAFAYDDKLIIFVDGFPDNPLMAPPIKQAWASFQAAFLALQSETQARHSLLAAVIMPNAAQVQPEAYDEWISKYQKRYDDLSKADWNRAAPNQAISRFLTEHQISNFDLLPGLQTYADANSASLYFIEDGHLNKLGHQVITDLMCRWMIETKLVPPQ
jgi:hypothetical protein